MGIFSSASSVCGGRSRNNTKRPPSSARSRNAIVEILLVANLVMSTANWLGGVMPSFHRGTGHRAWDVRSVEVDRGGGRRDCIGI